MQSQIRIHTVILGHPIGSLAGRIDTFYKRRSWSVGPFILLSAYISAVQWPSTLRDLIPTYPFDGAFEPSNQLIPSSNFVVQIVIPGVIFQRPGLEYGLPDAFLSFVPSPLHFSLVPLTAAKTMLRLLYTWGWGMEENGGWERAMVL